MLARMTLFWLGLLTATAAAETLPACWAPGDLVHRQGEERVQRGVAQARITAPKRTLAEYSPVAARGAVRRVQLPPGKKLVALTFDLCEQPSEISGYQGGIVDFLRSKGIKATFFIGGKWMLSHRERTQQLMAELHVRGRQPHLGAPKPSSHVGTGAGRRDQECAARL